MRFQKYRFYLRISAIILFIGWLILPAGFIVMLCDIGQRRFDGAFITAEIFCFSASSISCLISYYYIYSDIPDDEGGGGRDDDDDGDDTILPPDPQTNIKITDQEFDELLNLTREVPEKELVGSNL